MAKRLNTSELNCLFLSDLGHEFCALSEPAYKPLILSPKTNKEIKYKVYVYNCTNPPGGRTLDEYKIQLITPEQKRGERGHLDDSDGTIILIAGFAVYDSVENGVWVLWDTNMHRDFAYSANLQVKMGSLIDSITRKVFYLKKPGNGENIVVSDRKHLKQAIKLRRKIDLENLLEG